MKRPDLTRALLIAALASACGSDASGLAIRSITPAEASARGGEVVTIEGAGLSAVKTVLFGGAPADIVSASDGSLVVRVPRSIAGKVDVAIDEGDARATLPQGFTFTALSLRFFDRTPDSSELGATDGRAATLMDMDGDGDLDIVQAAGREGVRVTANDGQGLFQEAATVLSFDASAPPGDVRSVAAADFDGDGSVDVFFAAADVAGSVLLLQKGPGVFLDTTADSLPPGTGPIRAALAANLDADGDMDLVLTGASVDPAAPPSASLLVNDGEGHFVDASDVHLPGRQFAAAGVAAGDLDGDGDVDLLFAADSAPLRLYLGDGRGAFLLAPPDAVPAGAIGGPGVPALVDLDGDGRLDVYLPAAGQDRVYWNDGRGRLFDRTAETLGSEGDTGLSAAVADLDLDGHADVLVANQGGLVRMLRNDGTGRLFDYSLELVNNSASPSAAGLAVGDVDGDGDLDVFVSRDDVAAPRLYLSSEPLADEDSDGVPDGYDVCPAVADPEQGNRDSLPFGCASRAACLAQTGCELQVHGEKAYLFCRSAPLSWSAAAAFCAGRHGAMGTVADAGENAYLTTAGAAEFWLGYTDAEVEGAWRTAEGEPAGYEGWGADQPNDAGGVEDCASLMPDGTWNDKPCDEARAFFCDDRREKRPDPGDACDDCPDLSEPGSAPNDGAGGASCAADGSGGGG